MLKGKWLTGLMGLSACLVAALATPERLMVLGPMKTSLTSANEMTRTLAQVELSIARIALVALGLALIFLAPRLGALARHPAVAPWLAPLPPAVEAAQRRFFGASLAIFAAVAAAMLGSVLIDATPYSLTVEDGPFEQFTAYAFFAAGVVGLLACWRSGRARRTVPLLLMTAFFFVAAGEEISWGQRIWGFASPELVKQYNVQGETNIHNMFGYLADHAFIAGTLLYAGLLPLLCARWPALLRLLWRNGVPVGSAGLGLAFIALSLLHDWTLGRAGGPWSQVRVAEIREALAGLGYLLLMVQTVRMQRRVSRVPSGSRGGEASAGAYAGP